ncbi:MAG TPA: hypothetical protein PKJ19_10665 [Flavobacteriales bacterium]|nr:hypothetical protein [Flavobacteriales bacterium]
MASQAPSPARVVRPVRWVLVLCLGAGAPGPVEAQHHRGSDPPNAHRQDDSTRWDRAMLANDLQYKGLLDSLDFPLAVGVWPVEPYETPGNGSTLVECFVEGERVVGRALHVGRGPHNEAAFGSNDLQDEVVAVILVATDTPDDEHRSIAISRNHPNYLAEGRFTTTTAGNIDWITMHLADRSAYAIVNMRFFDLRAGRLILVAPRPDGTLRFLQRELPMLSHTQVEAFVAGLSEAPEVVSFFR